MLPDLQQFWPLDPGTCTLLDGILLQVRLQFTFTQQQLAQVIWNNQEVRATMTSNPLVLIQHVSNILRAYS